MTRMLFLSTLPALSLFCAGPAQAEIQLMLGFYVSGEDTPCEDASNATIGVVHEKGFNSSRRGRCEFTSVTWTSQNTFDYVEQCREVNAPGAQGIELSGSIEVHTPYTFTRNAPTGISHWGHCAIEYMPEPWNSVDFEELVR